MFTPRTTRLVAAAAVLAVCGTAVGAHFARGQATAKKADPEAYNLLKRADDVRQTLPANFAGVAGDITVNDNGALSSGTFSYARGKGVELKMASVGKEAEEWTKEAIASSYAHRLKTDFDRTTGSAALELLADDHSPIGRKVAFHDNLQSTDRVRDNQIVEVDRTMGKTHFIITVLHNQTTDEGKFLPSEFVVTYFDTDTGAIDHTECFTDGFQKIDGAWMPTSRRVVTLKGGKSSSRTFELTNLHLSAPAQR